MKTVLIVDLGSRMNVTGGQARVAAQLFRGLSRKFNTYYLGYETEYLKFGENTLMLRRGKALGTGLKKSGLSESALMRFGYNLLVARNLLGLGMGKSELIRRMREIKPDAVIANSIGDLALLKYLKRHGIHFKSIYIDHGSAAGTVKNYFSKEGIPLVIGSGVTTLSVQNALKKFFGFFDTSVALSQKQLEDIRRFTSKTVYIPNGISLRVKGNAKIEAGVRRRCRVGRKDFVILYLGRLFERQKNVSVLIRAFKSLDRGDFKLLIVGEGPSLGEYRRLAVEDERIVFAGRIEDSLIPYVYRISDLFVLPSNWEGFSLTILEAASSSLPIIVSKNIDSEGYRTEKGGLQTFESVEELKDKILLAYGDQETRRGMVAVSRALAARYGEKQMLDSYVKLISDLSKKQ